MTTCWTSRGIWTRPSTRPDAMRQAAKIRRRRLWQREAFTAEEMAVRRLALFTFALAGVTLGLAWGLTPADAAGPAWPTGDMIPDGMPMSELVRLFAVAIGRGAVVWGARFGVYGLLLAGLGAWVCGRSRAALRGRTRRDAWWLAALGAAISGRSSSARRPARRVPCRFCSGSRPAPRPGIAPCPSGTRSPPTAPQATHRAYETQAATRRPEPSERVPPLAARDPAGLRPIHGPPLRDLRYALLRQANAGDARRRRPRRRPGPYVPTLRRRRRLRPRRVLRGKPPGSFGV